MRRMDEKVLTDWVRRAGQHVPHRELGGEGNPTVVVCKCFFGGLGIARRTTSTLGWNEEPRSRIPVFLLIDIDASGS